MEWIIEQKHAGMMIRDFLRDEKGFSRRILKGIKFDGGKILVNGHEKTVRHRLHTGDYLKIHFPPEEKGVFMVPEQIPLDIIYEDEAVLVINKQAGIATIPSLHHPSKTVANGILYYYEQNDIPYTVHVVTRLDRDTSGLLLIAKNRYSHSLLSGFQKKGVIKRKYQAIVTGSLKKRNGTIDANIGRKEGSIIERTVRKDGKKAITHYQVLQEKNNLSLIDIQLETGRTHQIRVHMAWLGYPLVGDELYGNVAKEISRQALHCSEISFPHPMTREILLFQTPLPKDMQCMFST